MKFPIVLLAITLISVANALTQETAEVDHTDARMGAAMEKDPSTAGMVEAISAADEEWDARMNAAYKNLKKAMQPEEWTALVGAQKAWIDYRDAQRKSFDATFALMDGTMYIPIFAEKDMSLTRDRALLLEGYLAIISAR